MLTYIKIICIFVSLLICCTFSIKFTNATGFEDLLPLWDKSIALNEGGFIFKVMKKEIWKDIKGYEGKYQVSNSGQIKSLERRVYINKNHLFYKQGQRYFVKKERLLKQILSIGTLKKKGYLTVALYKNNIPKWNTVHRIVVVAFIPNLKNKPQVNHKNGIKTDNRIENLEWCTGSENMRHAIGMGLFIGEKASNAKLKEKEVIMIRRLYRPLTPSARILAQKYNVSKSTIVNIINRETWKHI